MYELEVNHEQLEADEISGEIQLKFRPDQNKIKGFSILPWEEHCTECAMPQCYQSCDLYEPRKDGKCRRFIGGIRPLAGTSGRIVKIAFKRWGQLMAYANINMRSKFAATMMENIIYVLDSMVSRFPDQHIVIQGRNSISTRLMRRIKQALSKSSYFSTNTKIDPDSFLLEIYNPQPTLTKLSLVISNTDQSEYNMGFQKLIDLYPGFHRINIDYNNIKERVDCNKNFNITLNPNILDASEEGLTLYFGAMTFIWLNHTEKPLVKEKLKTIKVIAWDLDNTLWDGILVEDGAENLTIKPGVIDIIKQLDKRGILNTVVSKNNPEEAMAQIERFGLTKYFIYPKIGWGQKGIYIKELVNEFNVADDTFAFIDDSPFERDEVLSLNTNVRVYDALLYDQLLELPEFNPPVSTESHLRRELYQYEQTRKEVLSSFGGEYLSFLKDCDIVLNISIASIDNIDRIQELVQRTNQLNFSGNRYQRDEIQSILNDEQKQAFIINCHDKYGQYGTIGFAIIDKQKSQLIDLMFSCRVQSKRVEHAFIAFLLEYYKQAGCSELTAIYHQNERNRKSGAVFSDMNFEEISNQDGIIQYKFVLSNIIPKDDIIQINWGSE